MKSCKQTDTHIYPLAHPHLVHVIFSDFASTLFAFYKLIMPPLWAQKRSSILTYARDHNDSCCVSKTHMLVVMEIGAFSMISSSVTKLTRKR